MKKVILALALMLGLAAPSFAQVQDAIPLGPAVFHLAPDHVKGWPITNPITKLELRSEQGKGVGVELANPEKWPDFVPPGWDGAINWTLWIGIPCQGKVHFTASIEFWDGKNGRDRKYWTGAPLLTDYDAWTYHVPTMLACAPTKGSKIYFMAVPVSHRQNKGHESVAERSQVVEVTLTENAVYTFSGEVDNGGGTNPDLATLHKHVEALTANMAAQREAIVALSEAIKILAETLRKVDENHRAEIEALKARPYPTGCRTNFLGIFGGSCSLIYQ